MAVKVLKGCIVLISSLVCVMCEGRCDPVAFVREALSRGETTVCVPKGRYVLDTDETSFFVISNRHDLTIDFGGSEFVCRKRTRYLHLVNCTKVTVRNVVFDMNPLPFVQGVIESMPSNDEWVVRVLGGYEQPKSSPAVTDVWPFQVYDRDSLETKDWVCSLAKMECVDDNLYRVTCTGKNVARVGDYCVWSVGEPRRSVSPYGIFLENCRDSLVENVTLYTCWGVAFNEHGSSGNTWKNCRLDRRPPETDGFRRSVPRLRSGSHDAFNSRMAEKGPKLENCSFAYHCDDAVNISGYYALVVSVQGRDVRVLTRSAARIGTPFCVGDRLEILASSGSRRSSEPNVLALKEDSPQTTAEREWMKSLAFWPGFERSCSQGLVLTLDDATAVHRGDVIIASNRQGSGWRISNCSFGPNRAHGVRLRGSDGVLENSVFRGTQSTAVYIGPEYQWLEGGFGEDILLRNNRFMGYENRRRIEIGGVASHHRKIPASAHRNVRESVGPCRDEPEIVCHTNCDSRSKQECVETLPPGVFGAQKQVPGCGKRATCVLLEGDTLYCGSDNGLFVYDVGDPLQPKLQGALKGIGRPRQLAYQDGYIYSAARETGVWIICVKDPGRPKLVSRFDTVELATGIDVAGDVLFVGQRQNGVEFIDVRDPACPQHIRMQKTFESQSVWYKNGFLYSGDWMSGEVTTIDAADMANVRLVGTAKLLGHGDGLSTFGNWLYASTGHHLHDGTRSPEENFGLGHGLEVFDLSDPSNPRAVSRVQFPKYYALGGDWWTCRPSGDGKTVFAADTANGIFAVDVGDPAHPYIIGGMAMPGGAIANYLAVGKGVVYVAAFDVGLLAVPCARACPAKRDRGRVPQHPEYRAVYPTPDHSRFTAWRPERVGQVHRAVALSNLCYVACGQAGLSVLEMTQSGNSVRQAGSLDVRFAGDVQLRDGKLYVAEGLDGLAVYSLDDPKAPRFLRRVKDFKGGLCCAIWVWAPDSPYVVVSSRQGGYCFLDRRQGLECVCELSKGCPGWDRYLADDVLQGRWLAQTTANTGFRWLDLQGSVPRVEGECRGFNRSGLNDGCAVFRGGRLLRMMAGGYALVSPGMAALPNKADWPTVRFSNTSHGLEGQPAWDGGNRLVLTTRIQKSIRLCDVTDERHPSVSWHEVVQGHPGVATFWKGRIVVPCGYQGLLLEKVTDENI